MSLSPNPTSLRTLIEPRELQILALVALFTLHGADGYALETDYETRAHKFLVEDGYLTRALETGTSRSYFRYRLTEAGRNALALKQPCGAA